MEEFNCPQLGLHKTHDRFREKNIIKSTVYPPPDEITKSG